MLQVKTPQGIIKAEKSGDEIYFPGISIRIDDSEVALIELSNNQFMLHVWDPKGLIEEPVISMDITPSFDD